MEDSLLLTILLCSSSSLLTTTTANDDNPVAYCPSDTNYTRGGAFQANLDILLSSLPATAAGSSTVRHEHHRLLLVLLLLLLARRPDGCRADVINTSVCDACLDCSAQHMAASKCAGHKTAVLVYDDCLLRYSDKGFSGAVDTSPVVTWVNPENVTDHDQARFVSRLDGLMSNLTETAPRAPRMFAAGSAAVVMTSVRIYGMAQCTRDLAADDCGRCLARAVGDIQKCCDGRQGGQVIYVSCAIRFEVYLFYNLEDTEAAMSPAGHVNGSEHSGPGSSALVELL
nr:unnamed protein product [Digitaria exilis]